MRELTENSGRTQGELENFGSLQFSPSSPTLENPKRCIPIGYFTKYIYEFSILWGVHSGGIIDYLLPDLAKYHPIFPPLCGCVELEN